MRFDKKMVVNQREEEAALNPRDPRHPIVNLMLFGCSSCNCQANMKWILEE